MTRWLIAAPIVLALVVTASALSVSGRAPRSDAGNGCTNSFAAFGSFGGRWQGTLEIPSQSINNQVSVDFTINADCTFSAVLTEENVDTWDVAGTFHDDNGGKVVEVVDDPVFADTTVNVSAGGMITIVEGSMPPYGIKDVGGTGSVNATTLALDMMLTYNDDSTAQQTIELNREDVPTPTPATETPSATGTPSDTPGTSPTTTPGGAELVWGNSDCDPEISTRDNQALLRKVLQQPLLSVEEDCPPLGEPIGLAAAGALPQLIWGDWDCDGEITTRDNQALLRNVLDQVPLSQEEGCPEIGDAVTTG
jgi:hypothetical protein